MNKGIAYFRETEITSLPHTPETTIKLHNETSINMSDIVN